MHSNEGERDVLGLLLVVMQLRSLEKVYSSTSIRSLLRDLRLVRSRASQMSKLTFISAVSRFHPFIVNDVSVGIYVLESPNTLPVLAPARNA